MVFTRLSFVSVDRLNGIRMHFIPGVEGREDNCESKKDCDLEQ